MKKSSITILGSLIIFFSITSCNKDEKETKTECDSEHWEYERSTTTSWATCYPECGGEAQSPINITGSIGNTTLQGFSTEYNDAPIQLINNGHTIQFNYESGSKLTLNGETYNLLQFHFHTGSEHTINNEQLPMEVHLVHQNAKGNLAVIGILFESGNENSFLNGFINNLPTEANATYSSEEMVNIENLFPQDPGFFTYDGSLTTPPCSEVVTWFVLKNPLQASAEQIKKMKDITLQNYRPVQPLNGREIKEFS